MPADAAEACGLLRGAPPPSSRNQQSLDARRLPGSQPASERATGRPARQTGDCTRRQQHRQFVDEEHRPQGPGAGDERQGPSRRRACAERNDASLSDMALRRGTCWASNQRRRARCRTRTEMSSPLGSPLRPPGGSSLKEVRRSQVPPTSRSGINEHSSSPTAPMMSNGDGCDLARRGPGGRPADDERQRAGEIRGCARRPPHHPHADEASSERQAGSGGTS